MSQRNVVQTNALPWPLAYPVILCNLKPILALTGE
jgi:hypothetical protein